jgi:ketosteroid isomerase-like protein
MAHPIEVIIREAFAAFARGDLDGYFRACSEDWNFNIAGRGSNRWHVPRQGGPL